MDDKSLIKRQRETIDNLQMQNSKLKRQLERYKQQIIKINGITMRLIHDE